MKTFLIFLRQSRFSKRKFKEYTFVENYTYLRVPGMIFFPQLIIQKRVSSSLKYFLPTGIHKSKL